MKKKSTENYISKQCNVNRENVLFIDIHFPFQMQSTFFLQGERMDAKLGSVIMPIAVLNVFNTIIILILIPIMDKVVYPFLAKYNRSPTHLQRIG